MLDISPLAVDTLRWLEASDIAETIRSATWLYAAIESLHLVGLSLLFGSIVALDLRLIGLSRSLVISRTSRHLLPLACIGFVLAAASGLGMFAADASALVVNPAFQIKLAAIGIAGINAAAFHLGPFRTIRQWDEARRPPLAAAVMGGASLLLWTAAVVCGRMIAYV